MSDFRVESVSNNTPDTGITPSNSCVIRVIGIGGGGGNMLQHMINESLNGVEFIAVNTDSQALKKSSSPTKVQIGVKLTDGLGAGCDPNKGRKAAEESKEDIKKLLQSSDMVFITAGMGGGTGTGAAPIIAEIAKESGALTVAVVTKPFKFEGKRHMINADSGITELSKHVDSLIVIDNDKLLRNLGANVTIVNAFNAANDVLLNAVRGITDFITNPGYINLDFADVQTVMRGRGHAMIGSGVGQGANFVEDAVERAIHSPLIEPVDVSSAAGLLVNVRVNPNFPITKWEEVCNAVQAYADEEADCKFGMTFDESISEDQIAITILITGISANDDNALDAPMQQMQQGQPQQVSPQMRNNMRPFAPNRNFFEGVKNNVQMGGMPQREMRQQMSPNFNQYQQQVPPQMMQQPQRERRMPIFESNLDEEITITRTQNADNQMHSRSQEDKNADLWDMPPILRSKSE